MAIIRQKDKIEKYLDSLVLKHGACNISTGVKSRYYKIGGKVLRVSDHIGAHSEGQVSIIVPSFREKNSQYIIHAHNSGQISVVDYEKVKDIARSFFYLSSIFGEIVVNREDVNDDCSQQKAEVHKMNRLIKKLEKFDKLKEKADDKGLKVLGVPVSKFTKGQLSAINALIKQAQKNS